MKLFKIVEIIVIDNNDKAIFILGKSVALETFDTHYESYIVSDNEDVLRDNFVIYRAYDFSVPPVNLKNVASGIRMLCLKKFY